MPRKDVVLRHAAISLTFLSLTLVLNSPQVILLTRSGFTLWYPTTGLSMALMLGVSPWYGILVCLSAPLTDALLYHQSIFTFLDTVGAIGVSLSYAMAAQLLRGRLSVNLQLSRRRDVVLFVAISSGAAVLATLIGVSSLCADHTIPWSGFGASAFNWFLADMIGLLGLGPFLLVQIFPALHPWIPHPPSQAYTIDSPPSGNAKPVALLEGTAQIIALLFTLWLMFAGKWEFLPRFYLSFLPIIWMAMRQGVRRVATGTLILNLSIVLSMHLFSPTAEVLAKAAFFMVVISATGLILGSEVSERGYSAMALQMKTDFLNALIENCPLGIVALNREGRVELANYAFERMFLYSRGELEATDIDRLLSPEDAAPAAAAPATLSSKEILCKTERRRRKDGKMIDVEMHAVPLTVNGRAQGAYRIFQDISGRVAKREADRKHSESLAKLVKELRRRTAEMALLNDMRNWLECCTSEVEACSVVTYSVEKLFPEASCGTLYLFKSSRNVVQEAVHWGVPGVSEPRFLPDDCWSLRRGQPHWTDEALNGLRCNHINEKSQGVGSLCVPMLAQGTMLGVFHLEFLESPQAKTESDRPRDAQKSLAVSVAGNLAQSLASLRLRDALHDQSIRDPLTGLFNRRFLEESLEKQLHRAARRQEPVSVLMIDLDHFKRFNDTFGHEAGDTVLRSVSNLFREFFRAGDISCRYGGEEFAIILPASSAQDAAARANTLRFEVKHLALQHNGRPLGPITLSVGVATFPDHGSTVQELFAVADHSLYQSKACGRDAVTIGKAKVPEERDFDPAYPGETPDPAIC